MTPGAVAGFVLSLALVLGLFGLAVRAVRRFAGVGVAVRTRLPFAVVQRVAVGPRQGLAVVRVGDRALIVSVGDGGVRAVTELTGEECAALGIGAEAESDDASADEGVTGAGRRRVSGLLGLVRSVAMAILPLLFAAQLVAAQTGAANATGAPAGTVDRALAGAAAGALQQQPGAAPRLSLQMGDGDADDLRVSGTVGTVLFLGLLTLLPTLLLLMTSFTRVLVVLHFLRQALGTQNAPPGHLLAALALLLTSFVMAPTLAEVNTVAIQPWMNGAIDEGAMIQAGVGPFRSFMLQHTPEETLLRFTEMSGQAVPDTPEEVPLSVLMTAFATSELKAAFQMGFALFLPFVVIDLVVSSVLTSMGMFMLPPTLVAMPCKLLLFVLVDGWSLIVGSLIASFQ